MRWVDVSGWVTLILSHEVFSVSFILCVHMMLCTVVGFMCVCVCVFLCCICVVPYADCICHVS